MAALAPQKQQCELGSCYPAQTFVKPPPRKAARALTAISGHVVERKKAPEMTIFHKLP